MDSGNIQCWEYNSKYTNYISRVPFHRNKLHRPGLKR